MLESQTSCRRTHRRRQLPLIRYLISHSMGLIECVLCCEEYDHKVMTKCGVCHRNVCNDHAKESCGQCDLNGVCEDCLVKHGDRTGHGSD